MVAVKKVFLIIFLLLILSPRAWALRPNVIKTEDAGVISDEVLLYQRKKAVKEFQQEKERLEKRKESPTLRPYVSDAISLEVPHYQVKKKEPKTVFSILQEPLSGDPGQQTLDKSIFLSIVTFSLYIVAMIVLIVFLVRRRKR